MFAEAQYLHAAAAELVRQVEELWDELAEDMAAGLEP